MLLILLGVLFSYLAMIIGGCLVTRDVKFDGSDWYDEDEYQEFLTL